MIYIVNDIYKTDQHIEVEFEGELIEFLLQRYPNGFGSGSSAVYVNNQKLEVEDYDTYVSASDSVVIMPNVPNGLETATIYLIVQIAVLLISVALSFILAPKAPKGRGTKGKVFTIGSGQNVPALGEVIAEHFGQVWFYPDVASQPYTTYIANEQYVYQILLIGAGRYAIDNIRFGNTDLNLIPAGLVEYRVFQPQDHKSQYGIIQSEFGIHEDVITSVDVQGLDFARNPLTSWAGKAGGANALKGTEAPTNFAAGQQVTLIGQPGWAMHNTVKTISIISGLSMFFASTVSDDHHYQVVKEDAGWRGWFSVAAVGKKVNRIDFNFNMPRGLYSTNDDGDYKAWSIYIDIQIQGIDDDGNDVGPLITRLAIYTATSSDPIRKTFTVAVAEGRYKARCRKDSRDDVTQKAVSSCTWETLKAYAVNTPGQYTYGDATLIAIKMKASEALSSTSDKVVVQATRILPTVESDFTVLAPTNNVCDAFAEIVRGVDPNGVDVPALKILSTRWENTNGFNFRFEDATTVFDALQTVSLSHRAKPQAYAKLLSMRPDDAKPFDQYVVSQEQMLTDSYRCGINIGPTNGDIDGYRVEYQDPNSTTILYAVYPALAISPIDVKLAGCTDQATAVAQAKFLWSRRSVLRRVVEFDTEYDALSFAIGDRIKVTNNIMDNVATVRLMEQNGLVLTVDGLLGANGLVAIIRDQYGQPSDPIPASIAGNILTLESLPPFPMFGATAAQENTTIVLGSSISMSRSYSVTAITPSPDRVSVSATTYSDVPYLFPIPGEVVA